MRVLSEIRYPTRWYSKLLASIVAVVLFAVLAGAILAGFVLYNIMAPPRGSEALDLANLPGHPEDVSYLVGGVQPEDGWFFPGLRSAPTILLCPGYEVNREELLPLATALQNHQYNVFLFDFGGAGKHSHSTLGFREMDELRGAVEAIAERSDVDHAQFGLWGTNMGAYAAMALAETDPRIRALAVESVYDRPGDMVHLLVGRYGLGSFPLLGRFTEKGFLWVNYQDDGRPALDERLSRLAGTPKLFIEADDAPELAASTRQLFLLSPEPKREAVVARGNYAGMLDDEKREYEGRLVSFFLSAMAP